jgi:antitoxin HicB
LKKTKNGATTAEKIMSLVNEYLKRPYGRVVIPEADGTFRAEITEFPGCIATGETAAQALTNLESVAASWLASVIARGQKIPAPLETMGFSGKLVLRLSKSLHRKAAYIAAREGVSLNSFIANSVAEQVGIRQSSPDTTFLTVFLGERRTASSAGTWQRLVTSDFSSSSGLVMRSSVEVENA